MKNKTVLLLIKIILCAVLLMNLPGCWNARELNDLEIVIGIGLDRSDTPGDILLTAQIVKPGETRQPSQEGGNSGGEAFWNVGGEGETVFNAVRDITRKTGNRLFVSHSQVIIFGRDVAADGLQKYIDFFLRSHEMRPTALILISQDTASGILDITPEKEKFPAINLSKLVKAYGLTSHYKKVNLQDFSARLMSKTTSPVAPLVWVHDEGEKKEVYVSGLAVFKNAKEAGTLDPVETRGLLWATGEVESGVIEVNLPEGREKAVLEINKAKGRLTPEIRKDKIYMHIEIKVESSLTEQSTTENLATAEAFEMLEKAQAEVIREEIFKAFEKSKELNADVFGFGESIYKRYRKEWEELEDKWDEAYPAIELITDIEVIMRKTDLITRPAVPEKE